MNVLTLTSKKFKPSKNFSLNSTLRIPPAFKFKHNHYYLLVIEIKTKAHPFADE